MPISRISAAFEKAKTQNRAAFVTYMMCGDPDLETSFEAAQALAENGADIIELGAPFTDPMADGPAIQKAAQRSLKAGTKLADVLSVAKRFRETNQDTPLIIMGYANPIHKMGYKAFAEAAADSGVDGVITVDLPPEEDAELRGYLADLELAVIRLATPTTTQARMETVANGSSGFVYYVSVAGITGAGTGAQTDIKAGVDRAKNASGLPVAVGFGVKTAEQAAEFSRLADGVVVGSAIVEEVRMAVEAGMPSDAPRRMGTLVKVLSDAIAESRS
ncbi:tryptophan synthase subunit alpha [Hirschia baltica]|uniref:Tryptophan synthase alpha chain n=1 Tax=Hirschia baltica (strain ATCC 49814 / DSM 5838 / IFAM 1418) TaxID=582402 RepID=C6XMW0_HIRBI|nr:tryptophan synthase subunit alpha [Hirschia baltica]ACT60024.1 tryptophan synthase, alpha subunit [Hirschia baltica ATCC 49814]